MQYTYIMKNAFGLIKVGRSHSPEKRRKEIESTSGVSTELLYEVEGGYLETPVHCELASYRKEGEWFDCDEQLAISILNDLKSKYDSKINSNIYEVVPYLKESNCDGMLTLTSDQLDLVKEHMLLKIMEIAETPAHLGKMLDINPMTIQGWIKRKQISKKGARLIEEHPCFNFSAIELRPDL